MDQRFAFSPADLARVKTVQFGIISPDEIVSSEADSQFMCWLLSFHVLEIPPDFLAIPALLTYGYF